MSKQVKWRRGTTEEHSTFIGAIGEVTVDTTKDTLVVHDGITLGGHSIPEPRDWQGFTEELFAQAGIVPSGQPDKLGASQRVAAIQELAKPKAFVRLNDFESLVTGGDWTSALQAALDTGKDVHVDPTKTYDIAGIVQSSNNKIVGKFNINPLRPALAGLGSFSFNSSIGSHPVQSNIRLLYCLKVYDLIELMYIRSMGFNMIYHGGELLAGQPISEIVNALNLMLDNANTANLLVNMTTGHILNEDSQATGYVTAFKDHPAVWGFSVFDEPSFNNVSVVRQQERLVALRALTDKNLNVADAIQNYSGYVNGENPWALDYDTMFVDAYSHTHAGDLNANITADLHDMRTAVGIASNHLPSTNIIPMAGVFKHTGFTTNINQIKATAPILAKCAGGDFSVFTWDAAEAGLTANLLNDSGLRELAISMCGIAVKGSSLPKAYAIGGTKGATTQKPIAAKDGVTLLRKGAFVDAFVGSGTALGVLRNGAEGQFTTALVGGDIAGLWFYGAFPAAITNIESRTRLSLAVNLLDVAGTKNGTLFVHYSDDEGVSVSPTIYSQPFVFTALNPFIRLSGNIQGDDAYKGAKLAFSLSVNNPDGTNNYRLGMHGFIIVSDW